MAHKIENRWCVKCGNFEDECIDAVPPECETLSWRSSNFALGVGVGALVSVLVMTLVYVFWYACGG